MHKTRNNNDNNDNNNNNNDNDSNNNNKYNNNNNLNDNYNTYIVYKGNRTEWSQETTKLESNNNIEELARHGVIQWHSFSPCIWWPLAFLIFSPPLQNFHVVLPTK